MKDVFRFILPILLLLMFSCGLFAQEIGPDATEAGESFRAGETYIKAKLAASSKAFKRNDKEYRQLFKFLARTERKLYRSATPEQRERYYAKGVPSFDSLLLFMKHSHDLGDALPGVGTKWDSLQRIQAFISRQGPGGGLSFPNPDLAKAIRDGARKERLHQDLDQLIARRHEYIRGLLPNAPGRPDLVGKRISIAKSRLSVWRVRGETPTKMEEAALELLRGTKGFNDLFAGDSESPASPSVAQLEKAGYQIKQGVNNAFRQQFKSGSKGLEKEMERQVAGFQAGIESLDEKRNKAQSSFKDLENKVSGKKSAIRQNFQPSFDNPVRGIPFLLRWRFRTDFKIRRSFEDKPAILDVSTLIVYQQTPGLKAGAGIFGGLGFGKNWQSPELSYQGVGLRGFASQVFIFQFGLEAGYEYSFLPRPPQPGGATIENNLPEKSFLEKKFGKRRQALYLGVVKEYKISKSWSGLMMLGYDFMWEISGHSSPFIFRLGWEKHPKIH